MQENKSRTGLGSRKGVTIVEVTVALVIITIVTAATMGIVLTSVNIEEKFVISSYTENSVESVLECFQFSEDADTFYTALQRLDEYERTDENTYVYEGKHLTVTVEAVFAPEKWMEFTAVDEDGEEIFAYRYPYEGGGTE